MEIGTAEISRIIKEQIRDYEKTVEIQEIGTVLSTGDGIARVYGLDKVAAGELLEFPHGIFGVALNLEEDNVGAALFGETHMIKEGDTVKRTGRIAEVPVGKALIGRVVNALGEPIDGRGPIETKERRRIEIKAPGIVARQPVKEPLQTGLKAIDGMIPIGRGQRELIIGDRQTGKTAVAIDTIINQKGGNVVCIYVAIGQKRSTVAQVVDKLRESGAMDYTTVVAATASESAPLQYIAPYSGCTMGEDIRENGGHALLIYDELAQYREMAAFAQFGSDLDQATQRQLNRGARLVELLKQGQYEPLSVERQILIIYAGTNGFVDELPLTALKKYEQELYSFIESKHPDIFADILKKRELDNDLRAKMNKALEEFKGTFKA